MNVNHECVNKTVVVYDGACGFCLQSIDVIRRWDRHEQFLYIPRQTPGLEERYPQILVGDFATGIRVIAGDGTLHIGSDAIYHIASRLPYLRWCAWMYRLPILNGVTRTVYGWIAANRMMLSQYCGGDDACKIGGENVKGHDAMGKVPNHQTRRAGVHISLLILLVTGLQASTFVTGTKIWPFMAYCMYSNSVQAGPLRTEKSQIVGVSASGKHIEIDHALVGLSFFGTLYRYAQPMGRGDRVAAEDLAERLNARRHDPIVSFQVKRREYSIIGNDVAVEENVVTFPLGKPGADVGR